MFVDVEAKNADEAETKGLEEFERLDNIKVMRFPYTDSEVLVLLELARISLADGEVYDKMAERMDLSDEYLKSLQEKLEEDLEHWDEVF
jgi:hypothetical protein